MSTDPFDRAAEFAEGTERLASLFDSNEGDRRRDEAMDRVAANAIIWSALADIAVSWCAEHHDEITTDDVWQRLADQGVDPPHEPRAIGPVMRRAVADGVIVSTDRYVRSRRPVHHRAPLRVYRRAVL